VKPIKSRHALFLLLSSQAVLSAVFVFFRTVEGDEGFYLAAAQRVADGMTLYKDFFFPQAPLMPLVFAVFSGWGMVSLTLLRFLSLAAGLLLTQQTYALVKEQTRDEAGAHAAAFLMAFSGMFLAWHSVFKPFAFVDLFLMLSCRHLLRYETGQGGRTQSALLSILFLSVAINFRSIFLLLLPAYLYLLIRSSRRHGHSVLALVRASALGLLLPSIPALLLFIKAPGNFWFDNLIFHIYREPITPFSALIVHKLTVFGKFLALPQTVMLLGALLGTWFVLKHGLVERSLLYRRSLLLAVLICAIYVLPTPVHLQYFQEAMPYLILSSLPVFTYVFRSESLMALRRSASILYLAGALPFVYLFILSPLPRNVRFELPELRKVISQIQNRSSAGDTLLSEWAGYPALSQRQQLPGTEHVGFYFPLEVESDAYRRNHLVTNGDIVAALRQQRPKLIVVDYRVYPEWQSTLDSNYHLASTVGETLLYERNHDSL
jgi:hypothetical protein